MGIEIEKKYRLTEDERERTLQRLGEIGATHVGDEFEENTLYTGGQLHLKACVLRLRRAGAQATLTYKERFPSISGIKHQREEETRIEDADAMAAILCALDFKPALVYEKRRATWRTSDAEIVVDELPFGLFLEIEGEEQAIIETEKLLGLGDAVVEMETYPQLTGKHGKRKDGIIEARFSKQS